MADTDDGTDVSAATLVGWPRLGSMVASPRLLTRGFSVGGEGIVTDRDRTDRRRQCSTATAPSEPRGSASGE